MKHTRLALALSAVLASTLPSISQAQEQDQAGTVANEQILLKQVMTDKRAVYARNLDMSASESAAFWPIYDEYEAKVKKLDDRFLELVNQYAEKYDSLPDTDATAMLKEKMDIEKERLDLKLSYTKKFAKVLSPKKALRYAQLESRIDTMIRRDVYSAIPLVK
jgi:hypothetical protein